MNGPIVSIIRIPIRIPRLIRLLGLRNACRYVWHMLRRSEVVRVDLPRIATPVYCRLTGSDIFVLWQTYGKRESDIDMADEPAVIIDGGAYAGFTTLLFANRFPNARILAVEPDEENCKLFEMNCAGYPNIRLIRAAVWGSRATLAVENPEEWKWALRMGESGDSSPSPVRGVTIPDLLDEIEADRVDLLKLDIEGAEKEVFAAEPLDWLDRVGTMVVELHDEFIPGCRDVVLEAMRGRGFTETTSGQYAIFRR